MTLTDYITILPYPSSPAGIWISNDTLFAYNAVFFTSYQWFLDGIAIPGATDSIYVFTLDGDYQIRCFDTNGCYVETASFSVNVGIHDFQNNNQIAIFPNPVSDNLFISSSSQVEATEIKIYNMLGEMVLSSNYEKSVNVHRLPSAIYWLEINTAGKEMRNKFVKQ